MSLSRALIRRQRREAEERREAERVALVASLSGSDKDLAVHLSSLSYAELICWKWTRQPTLPLQ